MFNSLYPGNAYVDWIGYDPYNFYNCHGANGTWKTFQQTIDPMYQWLESNGYGDKPFILPEYGTVREPERQQRRGSVVRPGRCRRCRPPQHQGPARSGTTPATCNTTLTQPGELAAYAQAGLSSPVIGTPSPVAPAAPTVTEFLADHRDRELDCGARCDVVPGAALRIRCRQLQQRRRGCDRHVGSGHRPDAGQQRGLPGHRDELQRQQCSVGHLVGDVAPRPARHPDRNHQRLERGRPELGCGDRRNVVRRPQGFGRCRHVPDRSRHRDCDIVLRHRPDPRRLRGLRGRAHRRRRQRRSV